MITITVQYEDLNEKVHTDELYFHLYKHQALDLLEGEGGLKIQLQSLIATEDGGEAYKAFKALVTASYGSKTEDGRFEKDAEATEKFLSGPAFDALITLLESNEQTALNFVVGIFPKGMLTDAQVQDALAAKGQVVDVPLPAQNLYVPPMDQLRMPPGGVTPDTDKNIRPMTDDEIAAATALPAGFRRPPVAQASSLFETYTREEILAAYDEQMSGKRPGQPPEPPAA